MSTISFDLVSPEKLLFNDEVGMIIVPGKDGDIGVLPKHSKLLSSLRPGRVLIYSEDKNLLKSFFVTGGFVEINPEKCILLAESVDDIGELEKNSLQQKMQELENSSEEIDKKEFTIIQAKIAALESSHYQKL